ncbi:glutathione synthetase [Nannochloropsis gaditana]|uniref:Glutathione synthetase n=2 Tax=Nannochloropsis gaditana TaxID=72520 RepID=W7TMH0_9STRA|nr:glutathione synthetase [Nannochloropsis gaditana]
MHIYFYLPCPLCQIRDTHRNTMTNLCLRKISALTLLLIYPDGAWSFSTPAPSSPPPPPSWLVDAAVGWASIKGLQMVAPSSSRAQSHPIQYTHLPVSLLPASFPAQAFEDVVAAAPIFNELVDRISRDKDYLGSALAEVSASDEFTGQLLRMYEEIYPSGVSAAAQPVALGLHRSDYMTDDSADWRDGNGEGVSRQAGKPRPQKRLLQVELNTIASSFGCLGAVTADLHRYLLDRFFLPSVALAPHDAPSPPSHDDLHAFLSAYLRDHEFPLHPSSPLPSTTSSPLVEATLRSMPPNPTLSRLPAALASAHAYYNQPRALVLFVVQPGERNLFDQRFLELALWEKHGLQVVRLSLEEVARRCRLAPGPTQALWLDGRHELAVVYFRAGYTPADFGSPLAWDARLLIEASAAVKCPTLGYQLAGTKKVQQLLCEPAGLSRFLSPAQCLAARQHFTSMYGLGAADLKDKEGGPARAVDAAIASPGGYVLKPQREGGGNNLYGEEMARALREWSSERLSGYVLMQRIQAPAKNAYLLREGEAVGGPAISELGIFGTFLGDTSSEKVIENQYAGYLVRTKLAHVNEGGVATGFAVVDSPMLVNE